MDYIQNTITAMYESLGIDASVELLGNSIYDYTLSVVLFALLFAAFKVLQVVVIGQLTRLAHKTKTDLDDTFIKMIKSFRPPFYAFLAFWMAFQYLSVHGIAQKVLTSVVVIWAVYQAVIAVGIFVEDILLQKVAKDTDPTTQSALRIISRLVKGVIWGFGILFLLSSLGVNITSLLAGVGIGGIAIAFALQGILSDLFSAFSIYFDKPFKVGDFIIVGDKMGVVRHIGVKSTRLASLFGEEIVLSNQYLTSAQVQNYGKMEERRVTFNLGLTYDTTSEKVKKAVEITRKAIESQELARLDRVHFKEFGDSALILEAVYYETTPDYNVYMDTQEEINFKIKEGFEGEGIEMAFPTQTVHVAKS